MLALAGLLLLGFLEPAAAAPLQDARVPIDSTSYTARDAVKLAPGRIMSQVTSMANPKQRYAVYLPSNYRTDRTWPLLILLDPRGRALIPLEEAQEVAERLGWMVLSSYGSRSDVPVDPNADVVNAMISDAEDLLALDRKRLYLSGFSGTARVNWLFAQRLKGHVAGLIAFGAGFPGDFAPSYRPDGETPSLAFFGGVGNTDFNFDEMRRVDSTLDAANFPHRMAYYGGPHRWGPTEVMTEGVEYMELQAMRTGLRSVDSAWVDASYQKDLARAQAIQDSVPYEAYLRYRSIVADYRGLRETPEAATSVARLKDNGAVKKMGHRLDKISAWQKNYTDRLAAFLGVYRTAPIEPLSKSVSRLELRNLMRQATDSSDPLEMQSAIRALAHVMSYTAFYEPEEYFTRQDPSRALAVLSIAAVVEPEDPYVCYSRARALTLLGRPSEAVTALACITHATWASAERLEQDPHFAPLKDEPGFKALLARLRVRVPADSIM
jgi:dienelactone hydrolase